MRCPGDRVGTSCSPSSAAPVWTQQSCPCPQGGSCIPQQGQGTACPPPVPLAAGTPKPWLCPSSWGRSAGSCCLPKTPSRALLARGWWHREGSQGPPRRSGFPQNPVSLPPRGCAWQDLGEQLFGPKSLGGAEAVPMLWGSAPASQPSPCCAHQGWGGVLRPQLGPRAQILIAGCGAAGRVETGC